MTREIKFRAWDTLNKEITYFPMFERPTACYGKNCEIMQFTGLHDKNGKEIYEGDIIGREVAVSFKDEKIKEVAEVYFKDGEFVAQELSQNHPTSLRFYFTVRTPFEIIGNIYENPELK